jgi:hypothetical protein
MLLEMCASQGCAKEQCALQEWSCNATAIACARDYLKCSASQTDRCSCAVPYTKCMSQGGCIDKGSGMARAAAHDLCLRDGCDLDVCDDLAHELEAKQQAPPSSRAVAVREALNDGNESVAAKSAGELGTSNKTCGSSTLRCSRSYADCTTRVANVYEWSPAQVRSSYVGLGKPFEILDGGGTVSWPGMDGSAAARVRLPLSRGLVRASAALLAAHLARCILSRPVDVC